MKNKFFLKVSALTLFLPLLVFSVLDASCAFGGGVIFLGDISFGENYYLIKGVDTIKGNRRYSWPLENFAEILKEAEMVIGNLETPATRNLSDPVEGKTYLHWTDPVKAPQALRKNNIKALSLANNHTLDYGEAGLEDTIQSLGWEGISWFGAGMDRSEAMTPLHFEFRGKDIFVIGTFEHYKNYEKYDFYADLEKPGVYMLEKKRIASQIKDIRTEYPESMIIIYPHWGGNYRWRTERQQDLGRSMIDAGADLVIGHGAHMMQEIENYRNCWIVYSLGNFVFNSQGRYSRYGVAPFSLIALLEDGTYEGGEGFGLKLYPIFTDNRITEYQGYFLDGQDFERAVGILERRDGSGSLSRKAKTGRGRYGYYIGLSLDQSISAGDKEVNNEKIN